MKSITFVRHSKSSWNEPLLSDHDRPLNNRGKRDSIFISQKLKDLGYNPKIIITSSAIRALTLAKELSKTLGVSDLRVEKDLYLCSPTLIIDYVNKLNTSENRILIVNHNPTITNIYNSYTQEYIHNVPTTGVFEVNYDVDNWEDINLSNGKIVEYIYPKMYIDEL